QILKLNPSFPSFSDGITARYSKHKGRHIVATRDIRPGELIAADKAYSTCNILDDEDVVHTICCVCLARTPTPLPCPQCTMVVFCSESCKSSGLSDFHETECSLLTTVAALGVPHFAEVLRILTKTTFNIIRKRFRALQIEREVKSPDLLGFNQASVYDSSSYETVYHLVGNLQERSVLDIIKSCSEAYIIIDLLRQCDKFFTNENGQIQSPSKDDLIIAGSACLTHLLSTFCNSFELGEYLVNVDDIEDYSLTNIGRGTFPSLALLNHSCNPSAMILSYGTTN
ncbi:unnamed protein product, partial [Meganyctiphanes norvegica]